MKKPTTESSAQGRRAFLRQGLILSSVFIVPRSVLGRGFVAPSDRINLGFIGNGKQAMGLQSNFLNTGEVEVVAACDVYESKVQAFVAARKAFYAKDASRVSNKDCTPYRDFREVLSRKDIDGVVIAVPDHWHAAIAVRAAEAGKDIYLEKPLTLTVKEGRAVVRAVEKHKRVFQTGSMQRSWPEFRQTAELVRNGYIGDLKAVKVNVGPSSKPYDLPAEQVPSDLDWNFWLGPNTIASAYNNQLDPALDAKFWARWRDYREFGGGGMTDWGAHMYDIVQWALDMDRSGPVSVTPPASPAEKGLVYTYANGLTVTHEDFGLSNAIRFLGSKGQIDIQRGKLVTTPAELATRTITPSEKHVYYSANHYKDWLQAMRARTQPICDAETGHRTCTMCNIGNIAYWLRRPLKWNPTGELFEGDAEANALLGRPMRREWAV